MILPPIIRIYNFNFRLLQESIQGQRISYLIIKNNYLEFY